METCVVRVLPGLFPTESHTLLLTIHVNNLLKLLVNTNIYQKNLTMVKGQIVLGDRKSTRLNSSH